MIFDDLGIDSLKATEIYTLLGMSNQDLKDPKRYAKFEQVTKFLSDKNDLSFWITRVTQGKDVDKLQQVWEYSNLITRRDIITDAYQGVVDQLSEIEEKFDAGVIKEEDEEQYMELARASAEHQSALNYLSEEISFYEN